MKDKQIIELPPPQTDLAFPLMKALENRRTIRKWRPDPISLQVISNLLWAACGITKEKKGKAKSKRTVPSSCNSQEIRVYILLPEGSFLYNEEQHTLIKTGDADIREHIGTQKMMKSAPMGLVYVADLSRFTSALMRNEETQRFSAWVDTGYISQNVYLYCVAAGLATAALGLVKRDTLHEKMGLTENEKIVLTQVIGYKQQES